MSKNNKFKKSGRTLAEYVSYCVSDMQKYLEYVIKKYETLINNLSIQINAKKSEKRISLKLQLLSKVLLSTSNTKYEKNMKLLQSIDRSIDK